jgi:putative Holliday junction resolvase
MAIAAIDYGRRWIGIAVADPDAAIGARPVDTMERKSLRHDLETLRARLAELDVTRVIVGLPLNMDGSIGPSALAAKAFAEKLHEATGLEVELYDERLTSFEAEERLRALSRSKNRKRTVDAVAASVILESWLGRTPRAT